MVMLDSKKEFEQLIKQHKTTIYTVCYMFSKDNEEVNDYFQECLINIWKGFDKFRNESKPKTWIYRVSFNTCISAERKKAAHKTVPLSMDINLFEDTDDETQQIRRLKERINKLGIFDRAIILLWLENMTYEEIGAIVGISTKNVSVRLFRIKEQLKKMSNI